MPGVPSGRGCEACRKQKKKCDQTFPTCSRCSRLRIECIGAGQRRFKFVVEDRTISSDSSSSLSSREREFAPPLQKDLSRCLSRTPSNGSTLLVAALIEKIKASDDLRYHLTWTYGDFLEDIPRRIGSNEALDASTAALVSAHSRLSSPTNHDTKSTCLSKYNDALRTVREILNDPVKARATETLCAVYLLLLCQPFVDTHCGSHSSTHTEGAAQILKARGYYDDSSAFEKKLLMSLRGPVLMEALLSPKIRFHREEWVTLVDNHLDATLPEGRLMRCWANMPDVMERGRALLSRGGDRQLLTAEARQQYQTLTAILDQFRDRFDNFQKSAAAVYPPSRAMKLHSHYQRMYGLALAITLISNCIVGAIDVNKADLIVDSTQLTEEVLVLADEAAIYRPLGASYVTLCLIAAACNCKDTALIPLVRTKLIDYLSDFSRTTMRAELEEWLPRTSRRLNLLDG